MIRGLCVQRKDVRNPLITLKIRQSSHLIPLHWCLCPVLDPHKHFKKGKNLCLCVQSINVMHIICHFTSLKAHCLTFKSISCVFNRNGENFFACLPDSLATAVQNGFFKDVKEKISAATWRVLPGLSITTLEVMTLTLHTVGHRSEKRAPGST